MDILLSLLSLRKILLLAFVCFVVLWSSAFGYFEPRYRCDVSQEEIVVSLQSTSNTPQKCFSYLNTLETTIGKLDSDISQAQNYITWWTDVTYRSSIYKALNTQKTALELSQQQVVVAMDDFERTLYMKVRRLLKFHLTDDRDTTLADIKQVNKELEKSKLWGYDLLFKQLSAQMEQLQYRLFLLDRIQFAHDFEELIPFLKEYLYGSRG